MRLVWGEFVEEKDGADVIKSTCDVGDGDCNFAVGAEGEELRCGLV